MRLISKSFFLGIFLFLSLIFSPIASAQEIATPNPQSGSTGEAVLVSEVSIENARISSQESHVFHIVFNFKNGKGIQGGVGYGAALISEDGKYLFDEFVAEDTVTLGENTTIEKRFTYNAPLVLGGSYRLILNGGNESGFPFGGADLGTVNLTQEKKGVRVLNDSCYLTLDGEQGSPHYSLAENLDINNKENIKLNCSVVNESDTAVRVSPSFQTRHQSAYGKVAEQEGGSITAIEFAKGEKKNFSLVLPKGNRPGFYHLKAGLVGGEDSSNKVSVNYAIQGVNGAIQKISLNNDSYRAGDKGNMTVLWYATYGNFSRSGGSPERALEIYFEAEIKNSKGRICASIPRARFYKDETRPDSTVSFDIGAFCAGPTVSAKLTDEAGNTLDQKDFTFGDTGATEEPRASKNKMLGWILGALALILILIVLLKKRHNNLPPTPPQNPPAPPINGV